MSSIPISLLDLEDDASSCLVAEDYQTREGKWCAGCGDFGAFTGGQGGDRHASQAHTARQQGPCEQQRQDRSFHHGVSMRQ